jgi:hypothetical protein
MFIFRSDLTVTKVAEFYRQELGKLGWQEDKDETFLDDELGMGGLTFAKGDDDFRLAIQDGQPESRTRIIIQGEGIVWTEDGAGRAGGDETASMPQGELVVDESHDLVLPQGCSEVQTQRGPYRQAIEAKIQADLAQVLEFYRRALPERGWKEDSEETKVDDATAKLSLGGPLGPLTLQLRQKRRQTIIEIATTNKELADQHGIVPKPGRALLMLGNAHEKGVVITVGQKDYRVDAGTGANDPRQTLKVDLAPGKHALSIKIPGLDEQTEELEIEAGTAWGVIVIPTGGYFADRMY